MFYIIPIGHESTSVRQQPLVSYAIIAICIVLFLFTGLYERISDESEAILREIIDYVLAHPYVELKLEFRELLTEEMNAELDRLIQEARETSGSSSLTLYQEQEHVDALIETLLRRRESQIFFRFGYIPSRSGHYYTLFTHLFLHVDFMHLFGNMLLFFLCGPFVEDRWGRPLFLAFYLFGGMIAALFHGMFSASSQLPLVGASGAISAVMGAFLVLYTRTRITFFYFIFIIMKKGTFQVPAYVVLPLWFLQQYASALSSPQSPVAFWAHVGGAVWGICLALVLRLLQVEEKYIAPAIEEKVTVYKIHPLFEQAVAANSRGQSQDAIRLLQQVVRDDPQEIGALEMLLELYLTSADKTIPSDFEKVVTQYFMQLFKEKDLDRALSIYYRIKKERPAFTFPPRILFQLASALDQPESRETSLTMYEELIRLWPLELLCLKALMQLGQYHLSTGNYSRAFSCYVMAKHHPFSEIHHEKIINEKIQEARDKGGFKLRNIQEKDVKGLKLFQQKRDLPPQP